MREVHLGWRWNGLPPSLREPSRSWELIPRQPTAQKPGPWPSPNCAWNLPMSGGHTYALTKSRGLLSASPCCAFVFESFVLVSYKKKKNLIVTVNYSHIAVLRRTLELLSHYPPLFYLPILAFSIFYSAVSYFELTFCSLDNIGERMCDTQTGWEQ